MEQLQAAAVAAGDHKRKREEEEEAAATFQAAAAIDHGDSIHREDALSQLVGVEHSADGDVELEAVEGDAVEGDGSGEGGRARKRQYAFIPEGIKERAIVLVVQHKCSVSDVAEIMGVSRGALYKHIERARKQMDDATRAKYQRRAMKRPASGAVAAAALALPGLQSGAAQPSPQVKNLVAKIKVLVGKSAPLRTGSPDVVSAADASAAVALVGAAPGITKDVVL